MLWCPNGLRHDILDVLAAPWRENNIFGFFRVRHANRERTKYGINNTYINARMNSPGGIALEVRQNESL